MGLAVARPAWDATRAPLEPKRVANEHAEARRAKAAAAAAALVNSPGNTVVAAAKREMAALSPDGAADGAAEEGAEGGAEEGAEEGGDIFLTSMGGEPEVPAAATAPRRKPAQRKKLGLGLSESLPELRANPRGGAAGIPNPNPISNPNPNPNPNPNLNPNSNPNPNSLTLTLLP